MYTFHHAVCHCDLEMTTLSVVRVNLRLWWPPKAAGLYRLTQELGTFVWCFHFSFWYNGLLLFKNIIDHTLDLTNGGRMSGHCKSVHLFMLWNWYPACFSIIVIFGKGGPAMRRGSLFSGAVVMNGSVMLNEGGVSVTHGVPNLANHTATGLGYCFRPDVCLWHGEYASTLQKNLRGSLLMLSIL